MKKQSIILGLILTLMTATVARAESCANGAGTLVSGWDGRSYCVGKASMNWWSAFAWCDAIGGTLLDITADCACSGSSCPNVDARYCMNLSNKVSNGSYWSRNEVAGQSTTAYYAYNMDLFVSTTSKSDTYPRPICRM